MKREQGSALVLTLWIGLFLSLALTQVLTLTLLRIQVQERLEFNRGLDTLLYQGLHQAYISLLTNTEPQPLSGVSLTITDLGSRINLNSADPALLSLVLPDHPTQAILDWRDVDDLTRPQGAESDYYLSLSTPYQARDGLLLSPRELLWIKGFEELDSQVLELFHTDLLFNINLISLDAFDALLVQLGLDPFRSQRITNDLLLMRQESPQILTDLHDLLAVSTTLTPVDLDLLDPYFSFTGTVDINRAPKEVLSPLLTSLGASPALLDVLLDRREIEPYQDLNQIRDAFPAQIWPLVPMVFSTEGRLFEIGVQAERDGETRSAQVILRREEDEDGQKILRIQRFHFGPLGK